MTRVMVFTDLRLKIIKLCTLNRGAVWYVSYIINKPIKKEKKILNSKTQLSQ